MRSRYSHALMLLCAILAFVPVLAVDYLLDSYARSRESVRAQVTADAVTADIQRGVYDGLKSIRTIIDNSPSLCTPTFVNNAQLEMLSNLSLRQIMVENPDSVQYCDGFGRGVSYVPVSEEMAIAGRSETLSVVRFDGEDTPLLKLTRIVGTKLVSALVTLSPRLDMGMPDELWNAASLRVSLTDGSEVMTLGIQQDFADPQVQADFLVLNSFAGEVPVMIEVSLPFDVVRANYADLDVALTIIACLMSGMFLVVALNYVRRSQMPVFDLENAIATGELKPFYQPVIDLSTGRLLGCEVLVRWQKKNGEIIPPGSFIDYAEMTGLAVPMTVSLMQSVRADLDKLCADVDGLKISINLFEGHFKDSSIVEDVQAIFGGSSIKFRNLVFEITERRPLANDEVTMSVINGLHAIGAKLALDDVGTGHSNLAYVQTLGVDIIKIDRVFVDMISRAEPGTNVTVLDALINMAQQLGTDIVAEGVETEEQAIYLRNRGVRQAQGYLFAPALKTESFVNLARALNAQHEDNESEPDAQGDGGTEAA